MVSLRDQTIKQLREEIAALKVERDEARALLEKWDKDYDGVCEERDEALAERDEMCRLHKAAMSEAIACLDARDAAERERDEARELTKQYMGYELERRKQRDTLWALLREVRDAVGKCHDCIALHSDETLAARIEAALTD